MQQSLSREIAGDFTSEQGLWWMIYL
ncbi:hypothetical protein [Rhodococcus sp. 077-4]